MLENAKLKAKFERTRRSFRITKRKMSAPTTPRKAHKVVLLGDAKCGKSSLLRRYTMKSFEEKYMPTVFDSGSADILADQNNDVPVNIWDTSGSSEYDHIRPLSFGDVTVFVICFDISKPASLDNVQRKWLPEIRQRHSDKPIILVGCKTDLKADQKPSNVNKMQLQSTHGLSIAKHIGAVAYFECSSKNDDDDCNKKVSALFQATALLSTDQGYKIPKEFKIKEDKKKHKAKYNKCPIS